MASTAAATAPRKSRWSADSNRMNHPGLPTHIPHTLTDDQLKQYLRILRIEEISMKLRTGELYPTSRPRSPSPEPIYGADGKRQNTRELRYRKLLEEERHRLVDEAQSYDSLYRPPIDYKKPERCSEKIYLPAREFPEINFIGLLIGPRGRTLKAMESETGCKISIRGRGSAKEGKQVLGEDEELHCLIMADNEFKVQKAVRLINDIIERSISAPETMNDLKREQLRELAALNGTLQEPTDNNICSNCGQVGHRRYECPHRLNVTNNLVCRICGAVGHVGSDCLQKDNPEALKAAEMRNQRMDNEYDNLMAELNGAEDGSAGDLGVDQLTSDAPWKQAATATAPAVPPAAAPAPWMAPGGAAAANPWAMYGYATPQQPPPPPRQ